MACDEEFATLLPRTKQSVQEHRRSAVYKKALRREKAKFESRRLQETPPGYNLREEDPATPDIEGHSPIRVFLGTTLVADLQAGTSGEHMDELFSTPLGTPLPHRQPVPQHLCPHPRLQRLRQPHPPSSLCNFYPSLSLTRTGDGQHRSWWLWLGQNWTVRTSNLSTKLLPGPWQPDPGRASLFRAGRSVTATSCPGKGKQGLQPKLRCQHITKPPAVFASQSPTHLHNQGGEQRNHLRS